MRALVLRQQDGLTLADVNTLEPSQLPDGDVTVDVDWSGINYKDALAITGKGKIIRQFPMVPGIDFAGTVRHSDHPDFKAGQPVVLTDGAWEKITGAGWRNMRGCGPTGWCRCRRG